MFYPLVLVYYILYMIMDFLYPDTPAISAFHEVGLVPNEGEWTYPELL